MVFKMNMIGWITLASSVFVSLSVAETAAPVAAQIADKPADVVYPFIAAATANDVYVRSGKGPGYYHCGKINTGTQITVIEESNGWAKILPLPENYSWIHKNYVELKPQTRGIGTVTGDNVRVWAGSDFIEPIRSFSIQTRLNTGELVDLFDPAQPETGDYYKIKSPSGAYLWVSSEYLRYVGPVKPAEPVKEPEPVKEEPLTLEERLGVDPAMPVVTVPTVVEIPPVKPEKKVEEVKPLPPSKETVYLQQCYDLSEQISSELKKPVKEQDYSGFKQQLKEIINDTEAGKSATYAKFLVERIERFELAIGVTQTLKHQDERLEQLRANIEQAHQDQVQKIPTPEQKALYTGTVKPSFVYTGTAGQKRYLLTDNTGRILCYMLPVGPEIEGRMEQLIGRRIGIRGSIVSDPKALVTLVSVTSIQTQD